MGHDLEDTQVRPHEVSVDRACEQCVNQQDEENPLRDGLNLLDDLLEVCRVDPRLVSIWWLMLYQGLELPIDCVRDLDQTLLLVDVLLIRWQLLSQLLLYFVTFCKQLFRVGH